MKVLNPLKAPFGKGKFSRVRGVSYQQWEDAFAVEFDDGLSFLEPHKTIRAANKISPKAIVQSVELDEELRHGFFVHYNNGQTAEVSWSFIRELPPKNNNGKFRMIAILCAAALLLDCISMPGQEVTFSSIGTIKLHQGIWSKQAETG